MTDSKHSIIKTSWRVLGSLTRRQKIQVAILFLAMLVVAALETVNLAMIVAYVSCIADPVAFLDSKYLRVLREYFPQNYLDSDGAVLVFLSIGLIGVLVLKNGLQALVVYCGSRFAAKLEAFWGAMILDGLLHMPYVWHQTRNSADLVLAVQWSVYLGRLFVDPLLRALSDVVMVTVVLSALVFLKPFLSLMVLSMLGGVGCILFFSMRAYMGRVAGRCKAYTQSVNRHVVKAIHGVKDVKVAGKESFFVQDYKREIYPLTRQMAWQQFLSRSPTWILEIIGFVMLTVAICMMFFTMKAPAAEITATMSLLAVTAYRVLPALNKVLAGVTKMQIALPFIHNEFEYLDLINTYAESGESPAADGGEAEGQTEFMDKITFSGVSFAYEGGTAEALQELDFEIRKGETLGVIGMSGAGKSTLVDLLIGLLFPGTGEIRVDGRILKDSLRRQWIQRVGYVSQFPYIYDGTLAENVAFGCRGEDIDRARVMDCCNNAAMQDFVHELSMGIDTPIGERGTRLSGGQQQRVIIARALYRNPSVLIFDEATSSLDSKSERAIQNTMYTFKGKQTLVVVAHRLSTVEECDKLLWLDKGRIRRMGTPSEVLPEYKAALQGQEAGV